MSLQFNPTAIPTLPFILLRVMHEQQQNTHIDISVSASNQITVVALRCLVFDRPAEVALAFFPGAYIDPNSQQIAVTIYCNYYNPMLTDHMCTDYFTTFLPLNAGRHNVDPLIIHTADVPEPMEHYIVHNIVHMTEDMLNNPDNTEAI